jgi:hypothetical protein
MSAFTKGLTTQDSLESHPATPGRAVFPDRFGSVLGTTGCKTAVLAQKGAQDQLVSADERQKNLFHY